jgi:periplasmic protein TonB
VFEQSLLLNRDPKRPWNFLASLSAELLVVSLALLIPLAYYDHLPPVHWKDIVVGPAPLAPPPIQPIHANRSGVAPISPVRPIFHLSAGTNPRPAQPSAVFTVDAPPTLSSDVGLGGATKALGTFIPNYVTVPAPPKPAVAAPKPPSAPTPVGGDVQMAKLLRKVIPVYPPLARSARISGVVRLMGTIGKDGTMQNLQLISGHPLLARAALEAVQQWIYKPTLLNGNPVEVIAPIEVNFTLGQ